MSSDQPTPTETNKPDVERQDSALYPALMVHYLHQDRLIWSRTQLFIAVQAAFLAAGFSQRGHWLGPAIMSFSVLLTFMILDLVIKDQADRDVNLLIMDKLADELLPNGIKDKLQKDKLCREGREGQEVREEDKIQIRLTATPSFWFIRGRYVIEGVLIMFILIDIFLAVHYICASGLFP